MTRTRIQNSSAAYPYFVIVRRTKVIRNTLPCRSASLHMLLFSSIPHKPQQKRDRKKKNDAKDLTRSTLLRIETSSHEFAITAPPSLPPYTARLTHTHLNQLRHKTTHRTNPHSHSPRQKRAPLAASIFKTIDIKTRHPNYLYACTHVIRRVNQPLVNRPKLQGLG
jgi:hypothetical protein